MEKYIDKDIYTAKKVNVFKYTFIMLFCAISFTIILLCNSMKVSAGTPGQFKTPPWSHLDDILGHDHVSNESINFDGKSTLNLGYTYGIVWDKKHNHTYASIYSNFLKGRPGNEIDQYQSFCNHEIDAINGVDASLTVSFSKGYTYDCSISNNHANIQLPYDYLTPNEPTIIWISFTNSNWLSSTYEYFFKINDTSAPKVVDSKFSWGGRAPQNNVSDMNNKTVSDTTLNFDILLGLPMHYLNNKIPTFNLYDTGGNNTSYRVDNESMVYRDDLWESKYGGIVYASVYEFKGKIVLNSNPSHKEDWYFEFKDAYNNCIGRFHLASDNGFYVDLNSPTLEDVYIESSNGVIEHQVVKNNSIYYVDGINDSTLEFTINATDDVRLQEAIIEVKGSKDNFVSTNYLSGTSSTGNINLSIRGSSAEVTIYVTDYCGKSSTITFTLRNDTVVPDIDFYIDKHTNYGDEGYTNLNGIDLVYRFRDDWYIDSMIVYDNDRIIYEEYDMELDEYDDRMIYSISEVGNHVIKFVIVDYAKHKTTVTESIAYDPNSPDIKEFDSGARLVGKNKNKYHDLDDIVTTLIWQEDNLKSMEFFINDKKLNLDTNFKGSNSYIKSKFDYSLKDYISVDYDNYNTLKVVIKDKAGNETVQEVIFFYIDSSRILKFDKFVVSGVGALEDGYIGNKNTTNGILNLDYSINSMDYVDSNYGVFQVGNNSVSDEVNDNYLISNNIFLSSGEVNILNTFSSIRSVDDWYANFSTDDVRKAIYQIRNIYGQYTTISTDVTFDLSSPTVSEFYAYSDNGNQTRQWTNSLDNNILINYKDIGSGIYYTNVFQDENIILVKENRVSFSTIAQGDSFNLMFRAVDTAGNTTIVKNSDLHYDSETPIINNLTINGNSILEDIYMNTKIIVVEGKLVDLTSGNYELKIISKFNEKTENEFIYSIPNFSNNIDINYSIDLFKDIDNIQEGKRTIYITLEDVAGNILNEKSFNIIYDITKPTLNYTLDHINSIITVTVNDKNAYSSSIKSNLAQYYLSTREAENLSLITNWISPSEGNDFKIRIPRGEVYIYVRVDNSILIDKAGNSLSGNILDKYYLEVHLVNNPEVENSKMENLTKDKFTYQDGYNLQDNGILVVFSKPGNALDSYTIETLNKYFAVNNKINGQIIGIDGFDISLSKSGTYAYNGVIFRSNDDSILAILDVVVVNVNPMLVDSDNVKTNMQVSKGEEIGNLGVSFTSMFSNNLQINETITLNGVKVDSVDTNLVGTYTIRTVVVDEFGNYSYLTRNIIVEDSIDVELTMLEDIASDNINKVEVENVNNEIRVESKKIEKVTNLLNVINNLLNRKKIITYIQNDIQFLNKLDSSLAFNLFSKEFFKIYDG